ncbi:MAG: hypothetical protein ACF788_00975 [Novipirellula sp. JB048]
MRTNAEGDQRERLAGRGDDDIDDVGPTRVLTVIGGEVFSFGPDRLEHPRQPSRDDNTDGRLGVRVLGSALAGHDR